MTYFKLEGHIRFENFISKLKKYLGMTSRLVKNQQGFSSHLFGRALVAIVFMLIGWLPSLAHDFEVDGVFYNITSDNTVAVIFKGNSYGSYSNEYIGDVVIPSSVDYNGTTYRVTSIWQSAFSGCTSLTSIEIPNSVTSIYDDTFRGCSSLTSIEIPNSVTSIGNAAFSRCSSLPSIEIPNSVTSIGWSAFSWCDSLTSIEIPNSVTSIGSGAFQSCDSLTSIVVDSGNSKYDSRNGCNAIIETASNTLIAGCKNTIIPNSVTSIGDFAFDECTSLTSIEIPDSVTSIGDFAFRGCSSLTSIEIPNSVTSIGQSAFRACTSLTSIEIPNSVTSIGVYAFYECKSLTSIQIPNSVTSIGVYAFYNCSSLTSIQIPNSVTSIGECAFYGCSSLTSIEIPNSVTNIGSEAFSLCTGLAGIEIPNSVTSIGDSAFSGCSSLVGIEIPNSVTSIRDSAFSGCSSLVGIEIPNSVTSIGVYAFYNCSSLTSIQIPNSVTSIGGGAFYECTSLTSIEIPNSVTSIGNYAFYECKSLTGIEIPNSVTSIGYAAFYGCSSLTKITCLATTPPTIESSTFSNYSAELYVPAGCISAYQSANFWKNFNIKEIPTLSTSIALNKTSASLKVTETLTLVATVLPENATNKSVTWKSSNEAVATVDANGKVTAVAVGEATITATTTDGSNLSASCKVTVVPTLAESITLDKIEISLEATETATLIVTVLPELTTDKSVEWSSSNESVATIDANGLVTAIAVGEAIITATTTDGSDLSASCKVTVVPTLAETITLDKAEISLEATETATLIATVLPELTTNKSVTWTSSNEAVVTVDANGVVTAIAVGEAIITATTTDGSDLSASCKVTVVPTLAESITLDKIEISLEATETATLIVTVLPELTTDKSVEWSSSNESVATIDANGLVTAIAVGEAIITATTTDGSDLSASCKVTVVPTLAETITLDKAEISLEATETATLIASVLPELVTDKSVEWSSSDETVAVVDENGVVTAIAVGEAIITATTADGSNLSATCKVTVVPTLATSITLDKTEYEIAEKSDFQLVATVLPELATDKGVVWSSSDKWVASVNENGLVTAYSVGEATITATTTDGSDLSASCKVTVVPTLAETITLDKIEISLEATETATLIVTVLPELTTDKSVEWSSSNESVATIDANGLVTAIAVGEAIITATTTDGSDLSASCKVTVVPTLAETITLDKAEISLEATETATLIATVLPELTTNKSVTWTSSNEAVVTVDANGVVTAIALGEAVIAATTTDGTNLLATCKVTVVPTLAETITLDKTEISLEATETATLVAIVLPELTTDKSVKWTSSDETVAVVDENGEVTAVAVGEATITATTVDDSNLSATCKVTVVPTLAVSIELDQTEASVEEKSDLQLTATILPEHATNKEVAWSSSDKWVATVDNTGLVTMYSAGEVIITATTTDGTNLSATCRINVYSGIDGVNGNDVIVATIGDNIVVKNAKLGSNVRVYAADGSIITSEVATDGYVVIEAPVKGIYVVAIDGKSFKVMVK